jgi:hypothetical protein
MSAAIAEGEIVPLIVRVALVSALDFECGILRRWTVRDPSVIDGPQIRAVVEDQDGKLVCSCERLGCRHVDTVELVRQRPQGPRNPCIAGDGDRLLA